MDSSSTVELVLLDGGRALDARAQAAPARGWLRVIRGAPGDLRPAAEDTVAEARRLRGQLEARAARALDGLLRVRAPARPPR